MGAVELLGVLALALSLSFLFWIFVAYGSRELLPFGVCSVCGSVVSVWGLNLVFGFLPDWVTLLLMGQSVVGGATMMRDTILVPRRDEMDSRTYHAVAQVTMFAFILGGTFALGFLGLTVGLR